MNTPINQEIAELPPILFVTSTIFSAREFLSTPNRIPWIVTKETYLLADNCQAMAVQDAFSVAILGRTETGYWDFKKSAFKKSNQKLGFRGQAF